MRKAIEAKYCDAHLLYDYESRRGCVSIIILQFAVIRYSHVILIMRLRMLRGPYKREPHCIRFIEWVTLGQNSGSSFLAWFNIESASWFLFILMVSNVFFFCTSTWKYSILEVVYRYIPIHQFLHDVYKFFCVFSLSEEDSFANFVIYM